MPFPIIQMTIQPSVAAEECSPFRRNGITCITPTDCIRPWSRAVLADRRQRRNCGQLRLKNTMLLYNITKLVQSKVREHNIGRSSGDYVVLNLIGKYPLYKEGTSGNGVCRYVNRCHVQGDLGIRYKREKIWMVTVAAFTVSSLTKFTTTLEQAVPKSLVLVI